ncbi:MAG: polyphenol oxidase family protein, partial [Bdellovibrionales bacterium]|nr:polyphenol oxidase family protein [Bdellovibrionales bacterium]
HGVTYWHHPSWTERGLRHGFLGRTLDARAENTRWRSIFGAELRLLKQVHGTSVCRAETSGEATLQKVQPSVTEADAWIIGQGMPETSYGILTADCVPVLLASSDFRYTAALHCGWRGTVGDLLPLMVGLLRDAGADPQQLQVLIGPAARGCCYEIGPEVAAEVLEAEERALEKNIPTQPGAVLRRTDDNRILCDISALVRLQALSSGVPSRSIEHLPFCTICDERFFSYRREKHQAGRQVSFLGPTMHANLP